jgi:hypothetical protein
MPMATPRKLTITFSGNHALQRQATIFTILAVFPVMDNPNLVNFITCPYITGNKKTRCQ